MPAANRLRAAHSRSPLPLLLRTAPLAALIANLATATVAHAQEVFAAPIWNGVYAGVHGGLGRLNLQTNGYGTDELDAGTIGVHIGLSKQLGAWVVGAEADIDLTSAEESADFNVSLAPYTITGTARAELSAIGSIRGRLGYAFLPTAMFYVTAGYAWASIDATAEGHINGTPFAIASGTTLDGFVYGAGLETFIAPQLLLRLEYLHTDYADQSVGSPQAGIQDIKTSLDSDTIRAGITWRFN